MPGLLVQPAAVETRTTGDRRDVIAVEQPGFRTHRIVAFDLALDIVERAFVGRAHHIAVLYPFAVDLVIADHGRDAIVGARLPGNQPFGPRLTQHPPQLRQAVMGESRRTVACIAPGTAKAGFLAFQNDNLHAGSGQLQRGRQAAIAGADDADIGLYPADEGLCAGSRCRGGIP